MNIDIGKFIRVVFNNDSIIQGTVEKWEDAESVIFNEKKNSRYIIYNMSKSVKLVQIDESVVVEQPVLESDGEVKTLAQALAKRVNSPEGKLALEKASRETRRRLAKERRANPVMSKESPMQVAQLKAKKMAELKVMEANLERESVKSQMKETIVAEPEFPYATPSFKRK